MTILPIISKTSLPVYSYQVGLGGGSGGLRMYTYNPKNPYSNPATPITNLLAKY